jgi:DNA-binding IclR family transcriptional regulator
MMRQISEHEVRAVEALRANGGWMTAKEVAVAADIANRTARLHCHRLAEIGVLDVAKVFGGFRYRMAARITGDGVRYLADMEAAKAAMI